MESIIFLIPGPEGLRMIDVEMGQPYAEGVVDSIVVIDRDPHFTSQGMVVPSVVRIEYTDTFHRWTDEYVNATIISKTYEETL